MIIDGKLLASKKIDFLKSQFIITSKKFFAAFLIGNDKSSLSFITQKQKIAQELNIDFRIYQFDFNINQDKLRQQIEKIVYHKTCGGAIVQLPLPNHINAQYVLNSLPREKDIDVLSERSLGALYTNRNKILPPAVKTVQDILSFLKVDIQQKKFSIVGAGNLVGKPIAVWLINQKCKLLKIFDINSQLDLSDSNVVISGVGKANLINPTLLQPNTIVIDFGYDFCNGKICGDFNASLSSNLDIIYTPTPGGTGPLLVANVFENFLILNSNN
ncbi:MAG: tetrahydrofolate dehydrogenase/cyclohydrolase catalytic domain-containing protein [Minisyncoccia bacterium]